MAEVKAQAAKGDQDPSMEEILQSIRRIIAEDDKPGAKGEENGAAEFGSEVLELTEMVQDDGSTVSVSDALAEPMADMAAPADVLANIDSALAEKPAAPPAPAPEAAAPVAPAPVPAAPAAAAPMTTDDSLLSEQAAVKSAASMKKAKRASQPTDAPAAMPVIPMRSGSTVEDLLVEAMRPMLKDWLDANLPAIVERIVEREVKKLRDQ